MTYDRDHNCAYCDDCSAKLLAGAFGWMSADEARTLQPIDLGSLRAKWSRERHPKCSCCETKLWDTPTNTRA